MIQKTLVLRRVPLMADLKSLQTQMSQGWTFWFQKRKKYSEIRSNWCHDDIEKFWLIKHFISFFLHW